MTHPTDPTPRLARMAAKRRRFSVIAFIAILEEWQE